MIFLGLVLFLNDVMGGKLFQFDTLWGSDHVEVACEDGGGANSGLLWCLISVEKNTQLEREREGKKSKGEGERERGRERERELREKG